jgi:hypothetical protein
LVGLKFNPKPKHYKFLEILLNCGDNQVFSKSLSR